MWMGQFAHFRWLNMRCDFACISCKTDYYLSWSGCNKMQHYEFCWHFCKNTEPAAPVPVWSHSSVTSLQLELSGDAIVGQKALILSAFASTYLLSHGGGQVPPGAVSRHTQPLWVHAVVIQNPGGQEGSRRRQRVVVLLWEHRLWSETVTMATRHHERTAWLVALSNMEIKPLTMAVLVNCSTWWPALEHE